MSAAANVVEDGDAYRLSPTAANWIATVHRPG